MATAVRPPGPKGAPLLGHLRALQKDPLAVLTGLARDFGDVAYIRVAQQHVYLFNHPDLIRDVLVTRSGNFTKSRVLQRSKRLLGEGLLTSEGAFHLRQRRLAQPAFHRERLAQYARIMARRAEQTSRNWRDGQTLDIDREMMRLTLAIVAEALFSADVDADADHIGAAMSSILELFEWMVVPFADQLLRLPLPVKRKFDAAKAVLDARIQAIIAQRRASGVDHGDLLSMLLLAREEGDDTTGMTDQQVQDEALTLFVAGHETTANALTWTWYLLSRHPEVESRLHEEIDGVVGDRAPDFDDLPNLRYTEMVFAEAMRLYPPAWAIGRLAIDDFEAGGFRIPARSVVVMSPYVMHRDPRYWSDPLRFDPWRFRPEAREARPKFSYFPFGGGPRVCIGERFAWMEGVLALAALGRRWRFELVPGHPVEPRASLTLRTRHGLKMVARCRTAI